VKALTIRQPWATLIALGVKMIETRSWRTNYRGPIAIHAGKVLTYLEDDQIGEWAIGTDHADRAVLYPWRHPWDEQPLPLGAVVATATLTDCVPIYWWLDHYSPDQPQISVDDQNGNYWPHGFTGENAHAESINDQWPYGDFTPGRWAWLLTDVTPCDPIPAKGKQGLWNWEPT
jgi:hypothetical protein